MYMYQASCNLKNTIYNNSLTSNFSKNPRRVLLAQTQKPNKMIFRTKICLVLISLIIKVYKSFNDWRKGSKPVYTDQSFELG